MLTRRSAVLASALFAAGALPAKAQPPAKGALTIRVHARPPLPERCGELPDSPAMILKARYLQ